MIHLLLDNGADVNLLDDYGISALNACYHVLYASVPQVYSKTALYYSKGEGLACRLASSIRNDDMCPHKFYIRSFFRNNLEQYYGASTPLC